MYEVVLSVFVWQGQILKNKKKFKSEIEAKDYAQKIIKEQTELNKRFKVTIKKVVIKKESIFEYEN